MFEFAVEAFLNRVHSITVVPKGLSPVPVYITVPYPVDQTQFIGAQFIPLQCINF